MSDQFFTDAPQHPKQQTSEELQVNAKPPPRKREPKATYHLNADELPAVNDDFDILMQIAIMLKNRELKSRIRILAALAVLLDS